MVFTEKQKEENMWDALREEIRVELDQSRRERKEIALLIEQSQLEVNKLAQRNASITAHLHQMHTQFEGLPRADIRMAYDSALDAQQRLFTMRGQLEKLQSDQTHMERHETILERVLSTLENGVPQDAHSAGKVAIVETVEMMIQSQEAERQRLSRQMHDGPAQALSNFILQTEIAMRLFDIDQAKAREELASLKNTATSTFQLVRNFIFDLRPMMLDDLGITPTLKRYIESIKDKNGVDVRLIVTGVERRLEPFLEVMLFRAVQELLGNAIRNGQATEVKVHLDISDSLVKIVVEDNGGGVDMENVEKEGGVGLKVIQERVEMLGGLFEVVSMIGQGTRINFQIPAAKVTG